MKGAADFCKTAVLERAPRDEMYGFMNRSGCESVVLLVRPLAEGQSPSYSLCGDLDVQVFH